MRFSAIIALAALNVAACAPSLEANGEHGVTIHQSELRIGSAREDAEAEAVKYCSQFGRVAHLESEDVSWFWSARFRYECV
jgi:hypothetical protein